MLRIYSDMLDWLEELAELLDQIARHDPDLAKQRRRSSRSVVLNTAEAMDARGRNKSAKYTISLSEMRESIAALDVSVRLRVRPDELWPVRAAELTETRRGRAWRGGSP